MKLLSRLNATRENGGPRKFTFEISMSGVVSVGIVVVLGMCWVFILGILVGRGYKPETAVPQIAQMQNLESVNLVEEHNILAAFGAFFIVVIVGESLDRYSARNVLARGADDLRRARDDGETVVVMVLVADGHGVADKVAELVPRLRIARIG